jgi:hypothetical protein
MLDGLDNDEYDRQHNEFYGINPNDDDGDIEHEESGNTKVLDAAGIWEAIREWMFRATSYNMLLKLINFQCDSNPKIHYWEDFLSQLTIIDNLDKRESLFRLIPLPDHIVYLADYRSAAEVRPNISHIVPSPTPEPPVLHAREEMGMWLVNINPHKYSRDKERYTNSILDSSVAYIVNA